MSKVTGKNIVTRGIAFILLLAILSSMAGLASPAKAASDPLRWIKVNVPAGSEGGNWVLASGSDVQCLAIAGDGTIYAAARGLSNSLFHSVNGGLGWAYIGNAHDTIVDLAVSPRDPNKIYYATTRQSTVPLTAAKPLARCHPTRAGPGPAI